MIKNHEKHPLPVYILILFFLIGCIRGSVFAASNTLQNRDAGTTFSEDDSSSYEEDDDEEFFEDEFDLLDEDVQDESVRVRDPLKPWNLVMFHFNDKLILWVIEPVSRGYKAVFPGTVRLGIRNFFKNLYTPIRMVNCILQAKGRTAEVEFARFLVNSTVGMAGFIDIAGRDPKLVRPDEEDLGQVLGTYGVRDGFFIVWPLLGPSTVRDTIGTIGDGFLNPLVYIMPSDKSFGLGLSGLEKINNASFYIGDYKAFKDATIDPYVSHRDIYLQLRDKKIKE